MTSNSTDLDVGDEFVVEIEELGDERDGISYTQDGFAIVVPDADLGERVRVRLTDLEEDYAIAERIAAESDVAN